MSPIIDIQRRMVEVGRLRMGHQAATGSGRRPAKLEHWRLTSRDQSRLEAAAVLYGGEVKPWEERAGEFELFTKTAELPILLLPGQTLSQWYELWSAGGCQRRCDGDRDVISEGSCICDTEKGDRKCKPTTRLSVMLPDVPGLGCWRLESHGYYAAVELSGTAAMLEAATARGQLLPARIRIDQRTKVEGGKTTRYAVPVIDIDITMRQALPGAAGPAAIPVDSVTYRPIPTFGGVSLDEGLAAVSRESEPRAGNGRQAAAIGPPPDVDLVASQPIPVGDEPPAPASEPEVINDQQRKLLWATAGDGDVPEEELRRIVLEVTGQESTKAITRGAFEKVLDQVRELATILSDPVGKEISSLTRSLLEIGQKRGKASAVQGAITKNRKAHAGDPIAHRDWLKAQLERAIDAVPA